jgi:hypothetical protein
MKLKIIIAVVVMATVPLCAQAQQPKAPKPTKADAQRVITIVSGDKAKTQKYCELSKLGEQMEQADQKKDTKKIDELSLKSDELATQLGPEYIALMDGMAQVDPDFKDGQEIGATLEELDKLCPK